MSFCLSVRLFVRLSPTRDAAGAGAYRVVNSVRTDLFCYTCYTRNNYVMRPQRHTLLSPFRRHFFVHSFDSHILNLEQLNFYHKSG